MNRLHLKRAPLWLFPLLLAPTIARGQEQKMDLITTHPPTDAPATAPAPSKVSGPYVTPDYIRKLPVLPPHLHGRTPRQLSLAQAIETSLRGNLDLALQRERVREVDAGLGQARAGFVPVLQAGAGRTDSKQQPQTRQEGVVGEIPHSTQDFWQLTLADHLVTGTDVRIDFQNGRSKSALGTAVAPEVYRSNLSLGLVQPILRDFSFDGRIQRAPILRAQFASDVARQEARLRALFTVKTTENAYWDLVQSWKAYEVNAGAYDLAEKQLDLTRRQIAAGVLPESDVIGVEGTVAQRQLALVQAEAQIERAADQLRTLINLPVAAWDEPIVPVDAPNFTHIEMPVATAVERAQQFRPELGRTRIDLARIALDLDVARNARLPRVDLRGSIAAIGQDEKYGESLDQVRDATGRQWSVAVTLGWAPLGIGARADVRRLESGARQNQLTQDQLQIAIRAQVREAVRAIATAERQLFASAKFRDLAERSLDVEQRRFLNSLSTNFIVAQRQAELAQARLAEVQALIQHERASSDLQLATGQLLEARGLRFDLPGS
jgi:outer membrane protein TolC